MAISLTESAATRVLDHLKQRGKGLGLRLGVKKTGCSGFAYVINYADEVGADDVVFEDRDVRIVVDRDSLPLIDGTQVDFVRQGPSSSAIPTSRASAAAAKVSTSETPRSVCSGSGPATKITCFIRPRG